MVIRDIRSKYISERIEEAFPQVKTLQIQQLLDNNENMMESFLKGDAATPVILFSLLPPEKNNEPQLTLKSTQDLPHKTQKVLYFIRRGNQPVPSKEAQIVDAFISGVLDGNVIDNMHTVIDQVFIPVFSAEDMNWGKSSSEQTKELLNTTKRFSDKLGEALSSKSPTITLTRPATDKLISNTPTAIKEAKDNLALMGYYENLVKMWVQEIQRVIDDNKPMDNELGPTAEIEYWKNRFLRLNSVMEQLKREEYKAIISALKLYQAPQEWIDCDIALTDAINEAKDNVKYLTSLEKYIDPLYNSPPSHIIEILPSLIKNISMMYNIAKYYSSKEKMEKLLVKISLQIIQNCKYNIEKNGRLWDQDTNELLTSLKTCIRLKEEYEGCYFAEKTKLQQQKGREFDFDELKIFGKLRLFCRRIDTLIELFLTIDQFHSLRSNNIEGMDELITQFFGYVDELKRKSANLLDYQRNAFDKEYMTFNKKVVHLEQYLQVFINTWFENISSSEQALEVLKKFKTILKRETLQTELENKYTVIFHNYGFQLENIQKLYEKYKTKPNLVRNAPPVAGKVIWCRQLMRRIEEPMSKFQQIPTIMQSKESKKIIKTYNKVLMGLIKFETSWLDAWKKYAEKAKDGLLATLLIRLDDKLFVNFDIEIIQLIRESKWLMRLGIEIPDSAKTVLIQEQKYKGYYNELSFVLKERLRILSMVKDDVKPLLAPHIEELEKRIEPGVTTLSWTSMNISVYLKRINKTLEKLEDVILKINDIIDGRIQKNLNDISNCSFFNIPESNDNTLDQIVDMQDKHSKEISEQLYNKSLEIERAVDDIVEVISSFPFEEAKQIMTEELITDLKNHYHTTLLNSLTRSVTASLHNFRMRTKRDTHSDPFFKISLELNIPEIILKPSLNEIQESFDRLIQSVLGTTKAIQPWKCKQDVHFYKQISKDGEIVKTVMVLSGSANAISKEIGIFVSKFESYGYLWKEDKQVAYKKFVDRCVDKKPTLDDFEKELNKYTVLDGQINAMQTHSTAGPFTLDADNLKNSLLQLVTQWKVQYANNLHESATEELNYYLTLFDESTKSLHPEITTLEDLRFVMDTVKDVRSREAMIEYHFNKILDRYSILKKYDVNVPKEEFDEAHDLTGKWEKLTKLASKVNETVSKVQNGFKTQLISEVKIFKQDVAQFWADFQTNGPMVPDISPEEARERLNKFQRLFTERERKYEVYKEGEKLFGLPQQEYPELTKMKKMLKLYDTLYDLYIKVKKQVGSYGELLWSELDFPAITDEVNKFATKCSSLKKAAKGIEAYENLKKTIEDFLELQPLLESLKHPAMRSRHWEKIEDLAKKKFKKEDEVFKLKDILEANLLECKEEVEDVCNSARKELEIEEKLKKLTEEWKDRELSFAEYKHRGPIILKGTETQELMEQLEEAQMNLGGIMGSKYLEPFRELASGWMQKLTSVTENIQAWRQVQSQWLYLEPVFASGDIKRQLPHEDKKFSHIDKNWVKIMQKAVATPNVIRFCYDNEMLKMLPALKVSLEECQKALAGYLEQKRDIFPRFYFNSDTALLEILSQSSDPHAIQPALITIFDSIAKITFDARQDNKILSMHSPEGEVVPLNDAVVAAGNVEDWLQKLEEEMQRTLRFIVRDAAEECSTLALVSFIEKYPAQVAILGIQFIWTIQCETALMAAKSDKRAMNESLKKIDGILSELTTLTTRELTPLERTKIETLITIQVHQKDVFAELVKDKVKELSNFDWQKQARFYWKPDQDTCIVSIADIDQEYCFEYLGCKERLVITPLTDRCYLTLAQAIGLKLGGAPAGPAGTGKTETVKDLGRTLGKYVVVFNCSDQMDYRAMGKIFRGLAQSGAWGDFDEFNRIELEVLSVVAQQIQSILSTMRDGKKKFTFTDGKPCKLDDKTAIFITMNPGYQGRQELPENLKVLFRGVAMMVPDRKIIIRVKLAAAGYKKNDILSKKFDVLYRLCEQQLSKQPHYDFGLRNILSVLRTAGETKRSNPEKSEPFLLMRTLRDMNTSKLVAEDVPLFNSLVEDLFPGINPEKRRFPELEKQLEVQIKQAGFENHTPWVEKVIQLYETCLVRHGIMVVGAASSGKSACYSVLLKTLSVLNPEKPYKQLRMNPKAITANQMFGKLDVIANEWTDGIFSDLWKQANKQKKQHIWINCDGPVDAIWIENLNTVLDDNKLLTLANGDRLAMSPDVKMCFEVENLNNASPATVSRAGQIYISESILGWAPVLESRLKGFSGRVNESIPSNEVPVPPFKEEETAIVRSLFQAHIDAGLDYIKKELKQVMNVVRVNQAMTCFSIITQLIQEHSKNGEIKLEKPHIEMLFWFSFAWSIGGLLETKARKFFSDYIKTKASSFPTDMSDDETIFDFFVDVTSKKWKNWKSVIPSWIYPENDHLEFSTLYVPTSDSVRTTFLIETLAKQKRDILFTGGSGTAKTVTIENYLYNLDPETMMYKKINFSSATTHNIFQFTIQDNIEKRFRVYGPPQNKKMVVFIDDINMPEINSWGDQVTNEIVRQLIEEKGFYSLSKIGEFIHIEDLQFIAAMSHPGGGKNDIPERLKRHFAILNITLPTAASIDQIYGSIIRGRYNSSRFGDDILKISNNITPATIEFWRLIQEKMLPTPKKFHYIFNLRDLSRVYQGLMHCPADVVRTPQILMSLWKHECGRVFSDRLNDVKDKAWFDEAVTTISDKYFGKEMANLPLGYFVNFLRDPIIDEDTDEVVEEAPKIYEPIESIQSLRDRVEGFMKNYNAERKHIKKLDLVLFDMALKHLVRISRILSMPRGNALLVGVGGSGKQSLTRLASFIAGYEIKQIVLHKTYNANNFFEDLRELYKIAGLQGKPVTFIFTDNEIKDETFLEYINSILSSGEVSGLFMKEEIDSIINDLRLVAKRLYPTTIGRNDTYDNLYRFFINRVRDNLHICLCFSPVSEKFRSRALKFPALISGCSVNWFFPWPEEALVSVAKKFLDDYKINCTPEVKQSLIKHMAAVHNKINEVSQEYFQRFRRAVHTTPKSYLSFIQLYKDVYKAKYAEIDKEAKNVAMGLSKLHDAKEDVEKLQIELKIKEKKLAEAKLKAEEIMKQVSESKTKTLEKKTEVEKEKDIIEKEHNLVEQSKKEALADLEKAKPALERAEKAVASIQPKDIQTVKAYTVPAQAIKTVFDGVLLLRGFPINDVKIVNDEKLGPIIEDSYAQAQKMTADAGFLKAIQQFKQDEITDETVELLMPYINYSFFTYDIIKSSSSAASNLCTWVRAMVEYHNVEKDVRPKRERLREAEEKLAIATAHLNKKMEELNKIVAEFEEKQRIFEEETRKKEALEEDAERTRRFMEQATSLIGSLGGESERWSKQSNQFSDRLKKLTGDVALACAFISYCGPFNSEFRKILLSKCFYADCKEKDIPVTEEDKDEKKDKIVDLLTTEAQIGAWNLEGLPTDSHSIQNAIMLTKSSKWALLVDPQGQGLAWLKKKFEKHNLRIARLTDKYFRNVLEEAISNGYPLIIENVEEEIDPMLDPLLEKSFVAQGKQKQVIIQDKAIDYDDSFKLFLTTKIANPNFSPELFAKCNVIDFTVTMKGLEQQLLGYVIQQEKAELEEQREKILEDINHNQQIMAELEARLLSKLSEESDKSLIEDEELIAVLAQTKKAAAEIKEKLNNAKDTEERINKARMEYEDVAIRGSVLYFLIVEMSLVNPMYQTSLNQFLHLFDRGIKTAPPAPVASQRIHNIKETCTFIIYRYISRGLFKRHKFLFLLLLTCKIQLREGKLPFDQFSTLLRGGAMLDLSKVRQKVDWLPDIAWLNVMSLFNLETFKQLPEKIHKNDKLWKKFYDEEKPEETKVPEYSNLTEFEKLLLIRSIREDRTILAAMQYIRSALGQKYLDVVPTSLDSVWKESDNKTPFVCLLSPGSDPTSAIEGLARNQKKDVLAISMGQGQEPRATEYIQTGFANGSWVLLQNCHLGLKFISQIEDMIKNAENIHPDFRIWLTSEPHPKFPIGLLQMSIKLTLEGDVGIKAGMKNAFEWVTQDMLDASKRPEWKPLIYTICFLSSIVSERKKFGYLGWNIPYEFNFADLSASLLFLQNHFASIGDDIKKGPTISWPTVRYMICDVHYGGKITDERDRLLFKTYGEKWLSPDVSKTEFKFFDGYTIPFVGDKVQEIDKEQFVDFIEKQIPAIDNPEVFGLHPNADITYRTEESKSVLSTILDVQPKESSGAAGETREDAVFRKAEEFLKNMPADFKRDHVDLEIKKQGGFDRNSLNVFLSQEIDRLQKLISMVRTDLQNLKLAIDGAIIMSAALSDVLNNIYDGRVPDIWKKYSWESPTIGLWFSELQSRHEQLYKWLTEGRPNSFRLTGFYNPQGFLTAVQQEVTRSHAGWALDDVVLKAEVTKMDEKDVIEPPSEGVYIHGLYLEGGGWDRTNIRLAESQPKILYTKLPVIHISAATKDDQKKDKKKNSYTCPVYRNKTRNDLTYIFSVELNCVEDKSKWKLRGVALLGSTQ
ncbi:hypothetical protein C9374_005806 [Naegleria lovaniensis]|uniref:AAA+ ATPase domain-containing protein n=1 Tax=Naegleria lovaniensis TaxID=51637 RepID=A0AA88GN35_NAELO|nr:uncharacterized protein C9374_005806 [Naegleria lovaniensis]KAG2382014.1 hypothetical protein C9374_005806 [Naegleria lovaniensis]